MLLHRTDKARHELRPGVRTLSQRHRTVLLLADGRKRLQDLHCLFDGDASPLVQDLMREGYLAVVGAREEAAAALAKASRGSAAASGDASGGSAPGTLQAPAAADKFEGKRSLATTRMFLFDLCERMFARRSPALAEQFREALRQARDRDSMLAASRGMLAEVEAAAGAERAAAIGQRIAMLLPPQAAE